MMFKSIFSVNFTVLLIRFVLQRFASGGVNGCIMKTIKAWVSAARLRTLPLSVSGIIVGSALAYPLYGQRADFLWIFSFAILTTLLLQILSNFANDYGDGVKGTDNHTRVGPMRALQSGAISASQMKSGIIVTSFLSLISALILIYISFGGDSFFTSVFFFVLGAACVAAAIKYTVGKGAYGYRGLGDLFVFIFFGLVSVMGSYYLYGQSLDLWVGLCAVAIGNLSIAVLNINNMRDLQQDRLVGKNTLAVKLGMQKAKKYHYGIVIFSMLAFIVYGLHRDFSFYQYFFILAYIPLIKHIVFVKNNTQPYLLDSQMKIVALSTFVIAVLFSVANIL